MIIQMFNHLYKRKSHIAPASPLRFWIAVATRCTLAVVAPCHLGNRAPMRYRSKMSDAATFIAPALLVTYLAVGCLLLWAKGHKGRAARRP